MDLLHDLSSARFAAYMSKRSALACLPLQATAKMLATIKPCGLNKPWAVFYLAFDQNTLK
jgi:hypothetical protein